VKESQAQKAILEYLSWKEKAGLCWVLRNNSISGKVLRSNGSVGWVNNSKKGAPDIIMCLKCGLFVGIEVKSDKGRQSPEQKQVEEFITKLGGHYILARGIEDVEGLFL